MEMHKPRFTREVYETYGFQDLLKEAEAQGVTPEVEAEAAEPAATEDGESQDEEDAQGLADLDLSDLNPDRPAEPTKADPTEADDAQKEAEKAAERDLHGRVSNVLSDISDRLATETQAYYQVVMERALEYLQAMEIPVEERLELLQQLPEVGGKIIQASAKSNFIDRDEICFAAVMEASVELTQKLRDHQDMEAGMDAEPQERPEELADLDAATADQDEEEDAEDTEDQTDEDK